MTYEAAQRLQTVGPTTTLDCGHVPTTSTSPGSPGWGYTPNGETFCYACAAERDAQSLRTDTAWYGYLLDDELVVVVSNWPGTLRIVPDKVARSKYGGGFGSPRLDVWFTFEGVHWHGVQRGSWNQVLRCKRVRKGGRAR